MPNPFVLAGLANRGASLARRAAAAAPVRASRWLWACCASGCVLTVGCGFTLCLTAVLGVSLLVPLAGRGAGGQLGAPMSCPGLSPSQGFGNTPWERPHTGIDLVCPPGEPVMAVANGIFRRRVGFPRPCVYPAGKAGGLGLYGELDAGAFSVLYGHLGSYSATDGAQVVIGQVLGFEGNSGCSSGFHLHFEIKVDGRSVNPCPYLPSSYPVAHGPGPEHCWGNAPP
jgi:murein DD-endopeptidase MepM/ murein hydrolase activator NlpD